jgi:hypothetical protein
MHAIDRAPRFVPRRSQQPWFPVHRTGYWPDVVPPSWLKAAAKVDDLVPPADELGNEVLVDNHRLVRLAGPVFALFSLLLVPWIFYVAIALPSRSLAPHYDLAWAGFDIMLFIALAATAYFALRRSRYLVRASTATATLLIVDAWFDVLTSSASRDRAVAILFAVFIELPLSALCWWLSQQSQAIADRRLALLMPRARRRTKPAPSAEGYSAR